MMNYIKRWFRLMVPTSDCTLTAINRNNCNRYFPHCRFEEYLNSGYRGYTLITYGNPVGYIWVGENSHGHREIVDFVIFCRRRRYGYGSELFNSIDAQVLFAPVDNNATFKFVTKHGWVKSDIIINFGWGDRVLYYHPVKINPDELVKYDKQQKQEVTDELRRIQK
jgi:hypothetical protein